MNNIFSPIKLTLEQSAQLGTKRIILFSIAVILGASLLFSFLAQREFKSNLIEQLQGNAHVVGVSVESTLLKNIYHGFTLEEQRGVKSYLKKKLRHNIEIAAIQLFTVNHERILSVSSDSLFISNEIGIDEKNIVEKEIFHNEQLQGYVTVVISETYLNEKIDAITYDILTVMAISLLLTLEMVLFITGVSVAAPVASIRAIVKKVITKDFSSTLKSTSGDEMGWVAQSLNSAIGRVVSAYSKISRGKGSNKKIEAFKQKYALPESTEPSAYFKVLLGFFRPTLFMIVFAEALSMSFFPLFVKQFTQGMTSIPNEILVSLPISAFMLFWAISIPIAGIWSDKSGRRKPMATGALFVAVGFVLTSFASSFTMLIASRAVSAVGYGMVYIAAQGFVADNTTQKNRTAGMASFISCFFSGALSGAAIGGVLVDRIGYRSTFYVSTAIALGAMFFALKFINSPHIEGKSVDNKFSIKNFLMILSNKKFLSLLIFSSIPAKICLAGYMYYIAPLFLNTFGINSSSVGRFLIAYGLSMVIISPLSGRLADKTGNKHYYVLFGGSLAGVSLCIPLFVQNEFGVLMSILGLGIAHASSMSSQLSLVLGMFKDDEELGAGAVIAIYRLIERIGNIAGPLIAGVLIVTHTFHETAAMIGVGTTIGALINGLVFYSRKSGGAHD